MDAKEKAKLHYDLMQLLTNCQNDTEFYQRLLYAKQLIENSLNDFDDDKVEIGDDYYDEYMGL